MDDENATFIRGIKVSEFRRRLAHYIARVRHGDDFVAIHRKGEDPVFLISKADFDLMEEKRLDVEVGPWCEKTKVRRGGIMKWLRDGRD